MTLKTRVMFMRHRDGHIFPALISGNHMNGNLVAAIQRVETADEFVWFFSKSFTVCAASLGSLALFGVRRP